MIVIDGNSGMSAKYSATEKNTMGDIKSFIKHQFSIPVSDQLMILSNGKELDIRAQEDKELFVFTTKNTELVYLIFIQNEVKNYRAKIRKPCKM